MHKIKFLLIYLLLAAALISCTHLKEYSQSKSRLTAISQGNLKGLDKVEIVKKFGEPLATSKSEVSECWYYGRPREIWIWFEQDRVERWETR